MRIHPLFIILILSLSGLTAQGQLAPGTILVADSGTLWTVDLSGTRTSFVMPGSNVYGMDIDYNGDLICGASATILKISGAGAVTTIKTGTPLVSLIGDIEINQNGNFYVTSMGSPSVWEMDVNGVIITTYTLTGSTRAWGIGLDPRDGAIYVSGYSTVHKIDPGTGNVKNIASGAPFTFLQSGHFGPNGTYVLADQNSHGIYEVDPAGKLTTVYAGTPFGDIGEGLDYHRSGFYVCADDSPGAGARNAVFLVSPGNPAVITTLASGSPFSDLNGCAVVPELHVFMVSGNPSPGTRATLGVTSSGAALGIYAFASALSNKHGIPLPGGKVLPLDPDGIFFATASNLLPTIFLNYQGILDISGMATLHIAVPNMKALVGITVYTAGITLHTASSTGIHLVSNAAAMTIVP